MEPFYPFCFFMIENILENYGFSSKGVKVYMACLQLGSAPVSTIGRTSGLNRVTVYSILRELCEKAIATEIIRNNVKYYSVISPDLLLKNAESNLTKLREIMPELQAVFNQYDNKPKIYFYEGLEGLKVVYEDLLTSNETLLSFLGIKQIDPTLRFYLDNEFLPKRINLGISAKVILSYSEDNIKYSSMDISALRETLVVKDPVFDLADEIIMYGEDKVSISRFPEGEYSGIIIHSKSLHDTLSSIFNLIWKLCRK